MNRGRLARPFARVALALTTSLGIAVIATAAFGRRQEAKDLGSVKPPAVKGIQVLFSGNENDLAANWVRGGSDQPAQWKLVDGAMQAGGGDIQTKETYKDFQLHVEFKEPLMPDKHGQERGNSGVYLQGEYEIQVLDSFGIADPGTGDCGAVYNQAAPLVNATKPPLEWQTYDITFRAPRYTDGKMTEKAHVTVLLNGITVQNNQEIQGPTAYKAKPDQDFSKPGPIRLQDHGNPLQYRNVWILPLPAEGAKHY